MDKISKHRQLKERMNALEKTDHNLARWRIIKECHINEPIWWNWMSGRTEVPTLHFTKAIEIIDNITFKTPTQ